MKPDLDEDLIPGTDPWRVKLAKIDAALTPEARKVAGLLWSIERRNTTKPMGEPAPIYRELAHNLMDDTNRAALIEALVAMTVVN